MKKEVFAEKVETLISLAIKYKELPKEELEDFIQEVYLTRKLCTSCNRLLERSEENFAKHPRTRDGFQSYCRDCGVAMIKRKRERRKEEKLQAEDYVEDSTGLDYSEDEKEMDYKEKNIG